MRKFFKEFKEFINRGNIVDLSVAVIIGSAFSAIVTSLTNKIIMPLINLLLSGGNGLESAYTMLKPVYVVEGDASSGIDLTKSIYIDWGAFITAIINFVLIALVIFVIVKIVNASAKKINEISNNIKKEIKIQVLAEKREVAIKAKQQCKKFKVAWKEHLAEKKAKQEEEQKLKEQQEKEQKEKERLENPTERDLLIQIRDLLAEKK